MRIPRIFFEKDKKTIDFCNTVWQQNDCGIPIKYASIDWQRKFLFAMALHLFVQAPAEKKIEAIKAGFDSAGEVITE